MKVKELRAELEQRGLPQYGRKAELVARLENVISEESYLISTVEEEEEEEGNELNESSSSVMASSFFTTAGDDDDDEGEDYNHEEDLGAVLAEIDENDVAMLLQQEEDDEGMFSTPFVAGTCLTAALLAASLAGEDQSVAWAKKPSHLGLSFASITKSDWVALLLPAVRFLILFIPLYLHCNKYLTYKKTSAERGRAPAPYAPSACSRRPSRERGQGDQDLAPRNGRFGPLSHGCR